ncbi:MAG: radical SAM protein [Verrucomicrobiota bacterium]
MRVKMILPALTEARSPLFRPVKYSLFPPLGLATLAAYLGPDDEVEIVDEHVQPVRLDDTPDLVVIQVYITNASRAYRYADSYRSRGVHVCLGGLHVTSLPGEAAAHADTIFLGPGEDSWQAFLRDYRSGKPAAAYRAPRKRSLDAVPPPRRDLIRKKLYLVPNSLVVSRGCPHVCDFCYKEAFFEGGTSFYVRAVDAALAEIESLPGRHLYFLDDHLFGSRRFAEMLLDGLRGMNRVWQAAGTVSCSLIPGLMKKASDAGLRSLFVGFENLNPENLRCHGKVQNNERDYGAAIRKLHELGIMINGSFVFGMDSDGPDVFPRTVEWAVREGIETATFHILTPYPGTALRARMEAEGRILHRDWDLHDTRHSVFRPIGMTPNDLERGYWRAYQEFYSWKNLVAGAATKPGWPGRLRHFTYAAGWKKFEGLWHTLIRAQQISRGLPLLESVLQGWGGSGSQPAQPAAHPIENVERPASADQRRGHGAGIEDTAYDRALLADEV